MHDTIFNVDATALFYTRPEPRSDALLDMLNDKFDGVPGCQLVKSPLSHPDWWLLSCETFHIMITFADTPAPSSKYAAALHSPINTLNRFEYHHVAQNHNTHLTIEVGDGRAPLPPEARAIMQEFGSVSTCDPALKMKVLHWTAQFVAKHSGFLAMHFGPSDRLLSPEDLMAAGSEDLPETLLFHPVPTELSLDAQGRETYALSLKNAHHLPGPAIDLDGIPSSVSLATAVTLLTTLYRSNRAGKVVLADGDVLSPSKTWSLYVHRAAPDKTAPAGRISLSFTKDQRPQAPQAATPGTTPGAKPVAHKHKSSLAARTLAALRKSRKAPDPAPHAPPKPAVPVPVPAAVATAPSAPSAAELRSAAARLTGIMPQTRKSSTIPASASLRAVEPTVAPGAPVAPVAPALQPAQDPDTDSAPRRVGLLSWMVDRCETISVETRARASGIVLIAGLLALANPYEGFTGGHDVQGDPHFTLETATQYADQYFAALWK